MGDVVGPDDTKQCPTPSFFHKALFGTLRRLFRQLLWHQGLVAALMTTERCQRRTRHRFVYLCYESYHLDRGSHVNQVQGLDVPQARLHLCRIGSQLQVEFYRSVRMEIRTSPWRRPVGQPSPGFSK